jgi:hypothetical protein
MNGQIIKLLYGVAGLVSIVVVSQFIGSVGYGPSGGKIQSSWGLYSVADCTGADPGGRGSQLDVLLQSSDVNPARKMKIFGVGPYHWSDKGANKTEEVGEWICEERSFGFPHARAIIRNDLLANGKIKSAEQMIDLSGNSGSTLDVVYPVAMIIGLILNKIGSLISIS